MASIFKELKTNTIKDANVFLCGMPYDNNTSIGKGAAKAPNVIRKLSSMIPPFDMVGNDLRKVKLYDIGDYEGYDLASLTNSLQFKFLEKNGFHIMLGGDHSTSIPLQRAFYCKCLKENKEPVIIHIDAHPDICDIYDNSAYSHACTNFRALEYGYKDKNLTMIGIRGFEEQEIEFFKKHQDIDVFKSVDVKKLGVSKLIEYLHNKYKGKNYLVYISYDIDANDPAFAPGTGTPEAFGLSNFETVGIIKGLISTLNVDVLDIVEVSPPLDVNNITSWLAVKTIYEVFESLISSKKIK